MSRRLFTLPGLALFAIALIAAAGLVWSSPSVAALIGVGPSAASPSTAAGSDFRGVPAGFTEEGHPFLGRSDAPVIIEEYTDFLCPFCARHATQTLPGLIEKHVATGRVKYVFRDMPLASLHPTAARGHAAARCAGEQGALLFWAMDDELFKNQERWRQLADPAEHLAGVAKSVGADLAAYGQCVSSGRMDGPVQQNVAAGQALGFDGTPSFRFTDRASGKGYNLVGAQPLDTFTQWIDAMVAGNAPPQKEEPKAQPQELPFWANQGLAPDPARPGFNLAGDPYRGSPQAKLVVVEFSNFQCPSCKQHELEVQPEIDRALVEPGQVMWVFKDLPLRSLAQSTRTAGL
jgi:protein-disulfide isomerase